MAAILRVARVVRTVPAQGLAHRAYSTTPPRPTPDEFKFPKLSNLSTTTKVLLGGGLVIAAGAEGVFWYKYFKGDSKSDTE